MRDHKCYYLGSLGILANNGLKKEYHAFKSEVMKYLKRCIDMHSEYELPWTIMDFHSLNKLLRSRNDLARALRKSLMFAWMNDYDILLNFHKTEEVRMARLPNLDGLYGGKPCVRSTDKSNFGNMNRIILHLSNF